MLDALPVLSVSDLQVEVNRGTGTSTILKSVSFEIASGEVFALVGSSGAGKTLLALSLIGLLPPNIRVSGGHARLRGVTLPFGNEEQMQSFRGQQIGCCSAHSLSLSTANTVRWHLEIAWKAARKHRGLSAKPSRQDLQGILQSVNIPRAQDTLRAFPHQLPMGMRQRLKIALASIARPALLIVDNLFSDLDAGTAAQLLGTLKAVARDSGSGILLITHSVGLVAEVATTVGVLTEGRIVEQGPPSSVFASPQQAATVSWLRPLCSTNTSVTNQAKDAPLQSARRPILRAIRLSKFYRVARGVWSPPALSRALRGISISIYPGQSLGVVGESGCGKSTLARLLLRLTEPSLGRLLVDEQDVQPDGIQLSFRRTVQFVMQGAIETLNPRFDVLQAVSEPLLIHRQAATVTQATARVREVLADVGFPLECIASRVPELSVGQAQQVALARALSLRPRLVVLDEPMSGLAPAERQHIANTLERERLDNAMSSIVLSHHLTTVLRLCERTVVLHAGSIVEAGPSQALTNRARHPYTRSLLASLPSGVPGKPRLRPMPHTPPPDPLEPIAGCGFYARCPQASELCKQERPPLVPHRLSPEHEVACWHPQTSNSEFGSLRQ